MLLLEFLYKTVTPSTIEQLPVYFYLITGVSKLIVSIGQFTLSASYAIKRARG